MDRIIYLCVVLSFATTWIATWKWIRIAPETGILGSDMNKPGKPKVPEMGGISVVFGFVMSLLVYVALLTFYFGSSDYVEILAALCTILMTCIIGMMDDLLGWKKGLKQWQKPIFTLFAAMPMMVINAGHSTMTLPVIGNIDWGILYPLMIVPIGIVGASNAFNMTAGYNGLEAGMGLIILATMGYVGYLNDNSNASILASCMVGALLAFLYFNWCPAKVFPGDAMTYPVGALVACMAILGNMEKVAVLLFIPYVVDFLLQLRSGFNAEAFARVNEDGSITMPFEKVYHLTHLAVFVLQKAKSKVYEQDVVVFLYGIELLMVGLICEVYL